MSIIDQIGDIEDSLQELHKKGDQEITRLNRETEEKRQQMQDAFIQDLKQDKENLTQEMLERVASYTAHLESTHSNIKELLEKEYRVKQKNIIQQICQEFWRI